MTLTSEIKQTGHLNHILKHAYASITDGNSAALISGISGKRIRIWRFHTYCGTASKTCALLSGTDDLPSLDTTKSLIHELRGSDGIPVFTCNDGDDFNADPSDTTNWYFYIVYSIE